MRLGDCGKTNLHTYSDKEKWSLIRYLDTGSITEGRIDEIQTLYPGVDKIPSRARRKASVGDILFSTVRPNQKHYGIIEAGTENLLVSTGFTVVTVDTTIADPYFIYYYLTQSSVIESLQAIAEQSTSTYPSIKPSDIEDIELDLPELETQKKIGSTLRMLDRKIALNEEINDNLLAQAQTLYKQFFPYGVQDDLPDGWRIGTVGEIIEIHDSKRIPLSGADRSKMEKKIYPYYGAASLMDLVDNYIFDGKYLLLGEDGTVVDDAGYPILQYVWGQFWVNNHAHILTGRLGYDVESLYMLFKQTPVKSIVTGAVQPKISQANLRSVQVVIPPEHNLREYNDLVEPLFSLFRANEEECKTFTALRDTLLPKLMSGEIDVSAVQL